MHIFFSNRYLATSPITSLQKFRLSDIYAPDNFYLRPLYRSPAQFVRQTLDYSCVRLRKQRKVFLRMRSQEINKGGACSKWAQPYARVSACTGITCTLRSRARIAPAARKTSATFAMSKTRFLFETLTSDVLDPLAHVGDRYISLSNKIIR